MKVFRYLINEVMLTFHAPEDLYIILDDEKSVVHLGPRNAMLTKCHQEEADIQIVNIILHAFTCGASNVLVKTSYSDVIVILVHHIPQFSQISEGCSAVVRHSQTQNFINVRKLNDVLRPNRSKALPLFMALTYSTSSLEGHSE